MIEIVEPRSQRVTLYGAFNIDQESVDQIVRICHGFIEEQIVSDHGHTYKRTTEITVTKKDGSYTVLSADDMDKNPFRLPEISKISIEIRNRDSRIDIGFSPKYHSADAWIYHPRSRFISEQLNSLFKSF